jgi:hypothetical protein
LVTVWRDHDRITSGSCNGILQAVANRVKG